MAIMVGRFRESSMTEALRAWLNSSNMIQEGKWALRHSGLRTWRYNLINNFIIIIPSLAPKLVYEPS